MKQYHVPPVGLGWPLSFRDSHRPGMARRIRGLKRVSAPILASAPSAMVDTVLATEPVMSVEATILTIYPCRSDLILKASNNPLLQSIVSVKLCGVLSA